MIRNSIFGTDDLHRVLLHLPVGLATVLFIYVHWSLALVFGFGFALYEICQDKVVGDNAHKDIKGWLWGMIITGTIILLISLF